MSDMDSRSPGTVIPLNAGASPPRVSFDRRELQAFQKVQKVIAENTLACDFDGREVRKFVVAEPQ